MTTIETRTIHTVTLEWPYKDTLDKREFITTEAGPVPTRRVGIYYSAKCHGRPSNATHTFQLVRPVRGHPRRRAMVCGAPGEGAHIP